MLLQISSLFWFAYGKATSESCSAVNGFRKAGIFPVNPLIFEESDFCPAEVTDRSCSLSYDIREDETSNLKANTSTCIVTIQNAEKIARFI